MTINAQKPINIPEYIKWLKEEKGYDVSETTKEYYDAVTNLIKVRFEESDFWVQFNDNLKEYDSQFLIERKYPLLMDSKPLKLRIKPFESLLLKTFRKNILDNELYPDEPSDGWILPDNWFVKINDIIRTLIAVKYLDGVGFMVNSITLLCEDFKIESKVDYEATEEGYYAGHLYLIQDFEIPRPTWDTERINISIEIQIITQLQEVIRRLLHKYYEERRKGTEEDEIKWQWNYLSDEFVANYLGHILHYVEGMIMDVRERQERETP